MGALTTNDFTNLAQSSIKDYVESIFVDDSLVEVRIGFPDFTNMTPLEKVFVTVSVEESDFSPSGYDDIVESSEPTETHSETRCHLVNTVIGIDVWTSRGSSTRPSKSGGLTGCSRYMSTVARAFTFDLNKLYSLYPDAEVESFVHQYSRKPESFDQADLFQGHGELRLQFPIEVSV